MRSLHSDDYHKGYFDLLQQYSDASTVDEELFKRQLKEVESKSIPHLMIVIEDL
jgi:hypothetical protein